jgi:hypothetical protein
VGRSFAAGAPLTPFPDSAASLAASALVGSGSSGAAGGDTLRVLIAQKERELHEISEYRLRTLETQLAAKVRGGCR